MSKKYLFLVISSLVLSSSFLIGIMMTKAVNCQSESEIEKQIIECKKEGLDYRIVYDENQCKTVKCIKMMSSPMVVPISEDFDGDGITNEKDACPKEPEVYNGFKDDDGCPDKLEEVKKCPPLEEIKKGIEVCKLQGATYEYIKDEYGCTLIKCKPMVQCMTVEPDIKKCTDRGLSYSIYFDENGCKQVKCEASEKVITCKKIIENNCVRIKCEDGYFFDSCTYQSRCRVECKTFTDNEGCFVKVCSDGSEQKECPKKEIKCEIFKTEEGCEKKVCTDGFVATHCPIKEDCKTYEDENGCKIKECVDGSKTRDCPNIVLKEKELECKVFIDERNCKIKICSNGLKIDYCAEPSCKVEVDNENCRIKKCDNGYVSRECPNKELIECQVIIEKETNCALKKCSNGYEEKTCPEEKTPVSFVPEISSQKSEGGGVFNAIKSFFRRLFFR